MEFIFFNYFKDQVFQYFLIGCNALAILVWLLTLITQNFSQMDRLWPILPIIYAWSFLFVSYKYNPSNNNNNNNNKVNLF